MDPIQNPGLHSALNACYGSRCCWSLKHLTALIQKAATSLAGLVFLLKCHKFGVVPSFVTKSVRFTCLGQHLERLAAKLPQRILSAAIRDTRAQLAALQKSLDATWVFLYETITDSRLWNTLVCLKDQFYLEIFMTVSWRLKKKFVVLFRIIPDDPYCNEAVYYMLALVRKRHLQPVTNQERAAKGNPVCIPSVKISSTTLEKIAPQWRVAVSDLSAISDSPVDSVKSPTEWSPLRQVDMSLDRLRETTPFAMPSAVWTEADSKNSAALWCSPDMVPWVPNPDISEFDSINSSLDLLASLDLAFVHSPSVDHSPVRSPSVDHFPVSRTRSASVGSCLDFSNMQRITHSMAMPKGRAEQRHALR